MVSEKAYLPPTTRRMGFPVRVMVRSEARRACVELMATLWLIRAAVGKEAILAVFSRGARAAQPFQSQLNLVSWELEGRGEKGWYQVCRCWVDLRFCMLSCSSFGGLKLFRLPGCRGSLQLRYSRPAVVHTYIHDYIQVR